MPDPANPRLYAGVTAEAKARFTRFPSAYASAWIVKTYKARGGKYRPTRPAARQDGVSRWMREQWVQVVPYLTRGETVPCGAGNKDAKACRPLRRVTARTPPTVSELVRLHGKAAVLRLARAKNRNMSARVDWKRAKVSSP